jgi:hypothetical protein
MITIGIYKDNGTNSAICGNVDNCDPLFPMVINWLSNWISNSDYCTNEAIAANLITCDRLEQVDGEW